MKSYFPLMLYRPGLRKIVSGISYFIIAFYAFPYVGTLFAQDQTQELYGAWIDLFYHTCNFLVVIVLFGSYIKESILQVQIYKKVFWSTVGIISAIVVAFKLAILFTAFLGPNDSFFLSVFGTLLTTEMDLMCLPTYAMLSQRLWGSLAFTLLCPLVISCLLYGCVFAPVCINHPRLAYIVMAGVLLLLRGIMVFCRWAPDEQLLLFLITLPVHLLACLSYHITDTVWAPIAVHTFSNLVITALIHLFIFPLSYF